MPKIRTLGALDSSAMFARRRAVLPRYLRRCLAVAQSIGNFPVPTSVAFPYRSKLIRNLVWCCRLVALLLAACCTYQAQTVHGAGLPPTPRLFPIDFEANRGQAPSQYPYLFHRDGMQAMFVRNGVDFILAGPDYRDKAIHMRFLGGDAGPEAIEPLAGHSNYFLGSDPSRWVRNVPLYSKIDYRGIYHGVSLSFYGNGQELEHDFLVDPGADPSQIVFRLDGPTEMRISSDGDLEIHSAHGVLTLRKPIAYQMLAEGRQPVDAKFKLSSDSTVRFAIGTYDTARPLIIDPVYVFSSYLGGSTGADETAAVTTDASGNILVTGYTGSTDFPTANALQPSLGSSGTSAFVTKFNSSGTALIYSTYLGDSSQGGAIALDSDGNAIIAGLTSSSDFPVAGAGTLLSCQTNDSCYFVASLSPDGSKLNYSGTFGGEQGFYTFGLGGDLAVDASGNAYLAGTTDNPNFQITAGTLATSIAGYPYNETFVLKVDPTGKLVYSTVIPGNDTNSSDLLQPYTNDFIPSGIAVDATGDVIVAGTSGLGLPTTSGVIGPQFPNAYVNVEDPSAGFVLQLNPTASAINYASYLSGTDEAGALTEDSNGNLWIAGETGETTLPVSPNAYQKAPAGSALGDVSSGYIMELSPGAVSALAATYLDGTGIGQTYESSSFTSIALDSHSNVFVGGTTSSADFPLQDPFVTEIEYPGVIWDAIVAEMSPALSTVEFGSFFNSTDASYGGSDFVGLTVDNSNNLIVTGTTYSKDFPTTTGSFEPQLPAPADPFVGYLHSFVVKINMSTPAPAVCFSTLSVSFGNVNANSSGSQTVNVTNCGNASLDITSVASSDPAVTAAASCSAVAPGAVCPVTLTFAPVSSKATSGTITLSDNAQTIPQSVSFTGQGVAPEIVARANPLSFGHVLVGAPAVDQVLLISNDGQAALTVGTVTVNGAGYSLVSNGCTQSLPASPYYFCLIEISFAPFNSGTQTGSIVISSNDPATPQLTVALTGVGDAVYAVPSISSLNVGNSTGQATIQIDNGPVTVNILGSNFYPQSVAQLDGVALTTTFQSNNALTATIPASALTAIGEQYLTVVNPLPGGGVSPSVTVTLYQTLVIDPSALVSVPSTGMLYAAVPSSATSNPNTVIPINAATGAQGTPIPVGNNPKFLAASSDGSYLFVANATDETVQRINLTTNTVEATFPYTPDIYCSTCTTPAATDLETVPGSPQEVLFAQGSILSLFNAAGLVNEIPTSACCFADPEFDSIALAGNPLTIYGLPFSFGGNYFQTVELTGSGLQYTRPTGSTGAVNNTTGAQVVSDGTLLYTSAGQLWNPATQTEVGTFPVQTDNATSYPNMHNINLDTSLGEIYVIGDQTYNDSDAAVISAYGIKSLALTGTLAFPQFYYPDMGSIVRWGTNGLAFIAAGAGLTDQEVYILRSSVVGQQSSNPTPVLNTLSPTSTAAGGAAFTLTVNGTGFLSSSVVEWNGTPLSTTYISAQQLTASVPAADIASAGSVQVDVLNAAPGGGSSASVTLTVNLAPGFALSASPASVSVAQNGSGTSTISVTDAGGFTGTVALAAPGLPSGVTANFAAGTAAGTQVLTLSASSTAVLGGPATVTVTGTSGALSATTTVSLTVTAEPSFGPSAGSGSDGAITVSPGATTGNTSIISVAGMNGYSGTVNLNCSISPTAATDPATCSLSPASVTLTGSTAQTSTLTVTTTAATTGENRMKKLFWPPAGGTALALVLLFGIPRRRRNWPAMVGLAVLFASICAIGCGGRTSGGGGGGNAGTSAGTYTVTVTGTGTSNGSSSSVTATVGTVTLTVN